MTVQYTIEQALRIFVPDHGGVVGCGRTDTGVHARDYYAHFDTSMPVREDLVYKLNKVLPADIAIYRCFPVTDELHARYSAVRRTYKYYLHFAKNPFVNLYSVYHPRVPDADAIYRACTFLLGTRDFSSFSRSQTQVKNHLCTVYDTRWEQTAEGAVFTIAANRFLRNMVRAIVGTLLQIGDGKLRPEALYDILEAKNRNEAGKSAHPQGLFLHEINYPQLHVANNR